MIKKFLSVYYILLFFITYRKSSISIFSDFENADFISFATPLSFFSNKAVVFFVVHFITVIAVGFCIFFYNRYVRIFACCCFLILSSLWLSFGKISHNDHIWIISSLLICIINEKKEFHFSLNLFAIRLIQSIALSHYFISGLWKLRQLPVRSIFDLEAKLAFDAIAHALAEGNGPSDLVFDLVQNYPIILWMGWIFAVVFQLSTIIPIVSGRGFLIWGLLAIVFHNLTGLGMDIWFPNTVVALLFFFIYAERLLAQKLPVKA